LQYHGDNDKPVDKFFEHDNIVGPMTEVIEKMKAYRARLKAAGRIKEAEVVERCIALVRKQARELCNVVHSGGT
jgi:hypothetical protein